MKRFLLTFLFLASVVQFSFATTYFKNWVNGTESNTMTQGDFYAWEYDVSVPGGSAHIQLFLDANHNQSLDAEDVLLIEFNQTDGITSDDGPPPDSGAVLDGIIYTQLGPFGFAPSDYIFHVEDNNDHSTIEGVLHINPPAQVNVWIIGHLSIEDVQPPDSRLANIMIEANREDNDDGPGWSGLTDANGNYRINLPDSAADNNYKISFSFENQIAQYVPETDSYHDVLIHTGENGPFDFVLENPRAWVYGSIVDENGALVPVSGWGSLENLNTYQEVDFNPSGGKYKVGAPFAPGDTLNVPFRLDFWSDELIPDYLIPNSWENPYYTFQLSLGDSVEKNIQVYSTDAVIYVFARQDSQPLSGNYEAHANNQLYGQTFARLNGDPITVLHVRSGAQYNVGLSNQEEGGLALPPGYYIFPANWQQAMPGDTVRFFIKHTANLFKGHIHFAPGDPVSDLENCVIEAFTFNWERYVQAPIDPDSLSFAFGVPNDTFSVRATCWNGDYLANPVQYDNIIANNDTVNNLDFTLNYAHANLTVKLVNAPVDPMQSYWMTITTLGTYPFVYQTSSMMATDSAFYFRVCDGQWQIFPPDFGPEYAANPPQIEVDVNNDSTNYYVEFNYVSTGIEDQEPVPQSFYVKQNYPNPFNPSTTLEFGLPVQEDVTVRIYNLAGQQVCKLFEGTMSAGVHRLKWNASDFASGMYFYKVQTPEKTIIHRMLLIK